MWIKHIQRQSLNAIVHFISVQASFHVPLGQNKKPGRIFYDGAGL